MIEGLTTSLQELAAQQERLRVEFRRMCGLTSTEVMVLHRACCGHASQAAIAKALHKSPSTITAAVDRLTAMELLEREQDNLDRRKLILRPTARGTRWSHQMDDPLERAARAQTGRLSEDQMMCVAAFLAALCISLAVEHAPMMVI